MKQKIKIFLFILIIFSTVGCNRNNENSTKNISGVKIDKGVYKYDLAGEITNLTVHDKSIYYISNNTLYKQNIFSDNKEQQNLSEDYSYSFDRNFIEKYTDKEIFYLDYSLKEKIKIQDFNEYTFVTPYKNSYIGIKDNKIYFNGTILKELDNKVSSSTVINYFYNLDNTYLVFYNNDSKKSYVYDINNNEYEDIEKYYINSFNNGYYLYNKNDFIIKNYSDNKTDKYTNITDSDDLSLCDMSDYKLYCVDKNLLKVYDFKNNTISRFKNGFSDIFNINIEDNIGYLTSTDNIEYVIDLKSAEKTTYSINEYEEELNKSLVNKINKIKKENNVNVFIKDDTNRKYNDFSVELEQDYEILDYTLDKTQELLNLFNSETFNKINGGISIYLVNKVIPSDLSTQAANPLAYTYREDDKYLIAISTSATDYKKLLSHEIMHCLEFNITDNEKFKEWNNYNPDDFLYTNSYAIESDFNYTLENELDKNDVYFIDEYSHTFDFEDRARIFENIVNEDKINFKEYQHLYKKILYLKEELIKYYPSLKNSKVFDLL